MSVEGLQNRAFAYSYTGHYAKAIEDCQIALALDPQYSRARNLIGSIHLKLHQYDEALAAFDQTLKLDPDYAFSYHNRGEVYLLRGEYQAAIENFQQTLRLLPDSLPTQAGLAVAKYRSGQVEEAKQLWESLMKQDEKYRHPKQADLDWSAELIAAAEELIKDISKGRSDSLRL